MKKVVRMSLLALTAVALLGSCKKKNNEPAPDPGSGTGTTTGGGNGNGGGTQTSAPASVITLSLPAGQKFALKGIEGENITIGGVPVENLAYKSSNTPKEFTAKMNQVEIKGNIKSLSFSGGAFEKLEVPNGLEVLRLLTGTKVNVLNLTQTKSLKTLTLEGTGLTNEQDLTNHTNLKTVLLSGGVGGSVLLPNSVETLRVEEHYAGLKTVINKTNFPKMKTLQIMTVNTPSVSLSNVDFSGSTTLENITIYSSGVKGINLKDAKALKSATIYNANGFSSIDLSGCTALKDYQQSTGLRIWKNENAQPPLTTLSLSGTAITQFKKMDKAIGENPYLTSLDLSSTKLIEAKFDDLKNLKTLNLLNTPGLTGTKLSEALTSLPRVTGGTLKITGLSTSDRDIATGKGWNVVAQ